MFFFTKKPRDMPLPLDASAPALFVSENDGLTFRPAQRSEILQAAQRALANQIRPGANLIEPNAAIEYLRVRMGSLPYELFAVMFLDACHKLICFEEMFRGTLTHATVHPREIARQVLEHNAAGVILVHNHPCGSLEISRADELLTQNVKSALALIDVCVHDHLIITAAGCTSMAEKGWVV